MHAEAVALSRLQVKVAPLPVEWKVTLALVELVRAGGGVSITVAGVVE